MRVLSVPLPLALSLAALASCADQAGVPYEPAAAGGAEATPVSLDAARPHYRKELRRAALRGIRYDGERAEIVPEEAAELVSGPDAGAAARALAEGRELVARNAVIEAIAAHTRAVLLAPDEPLAWGALGDVLMTNRRGGKALAAYRSALELAPDSAGLHERAARALVSVGRRSEAVVELRTATRLEPARTEAFELLAIQLYYLEDDAAAWEAVHRAEAADGSLPPQFRTLLAARTPEVN